MGEGLHQLHGGAIGLVTESRGARHLHGFDLGSRSDLSHARQHLFIAIMLKSVEQFLRVILRNITQIPNEFTVTRDDVDGCATFNRTDMYRGPGRIKVIVTRGIGL